MPAPIRSGAGICAQTEVNTVSTDPDRRKQWLDRVQATWDERSGWWDDMSEENAASADRALDLDRTIDRLRLHPGDRVYDAGCGSGQFAIAFAARGFDVVAADLAPAMIERARQHAQNRGLTIDWRVAKSVTRPFTRE